MLKRAWAFIRKDFLIESSYRIVFVSNIAGVVLSMLVYFFIDRLFGSRMVSHLERFGVNYFSYVLLGMAFFSYVGVGLSSFSGQIRNEQTQGTLEAILLAPVKISTILFSMGMWNLIFATFDMLIYICVGKFLFGIDFSSLNIPSTLLILALTITSFSGLGILSASFIMVFKRGNPAAWLLGSVEGLVGGVYFPISVLPGWLQTLAHFFPITYAIRAIQLAVYRGFTTRQLSSEIAMLLLFSCILLPLGLKVFSSALRRAQRDGTLGQF